MKHNNTELQLFKSANNIFLEFDRWKALVNSSELEKETIDSFFVSRKLATKIVDTIDATQILFNERKFYASYIVLRTAIESLIWFIFITNDENNKQYYLHKYFDENIKSIKTRLDFPNTPFMDATQKNEKQELIKYWKGKKENLKNDHPESNTLGIKSVVKMIGGPAEYIYCYHYNIASSYAHPDFYTTIESYIPKDNNETSFLVNSEYTDIRNVIVLAEGIKCTMTTTMSHIDKLIDVNSEQYIDNIEKYFKDIRILAP